MRNLNKQQKKMLKDLQIVSFALDDVRLFLDTHPKDKEALQYFEYFNKLRKELLQELGKSGYPVLPDNVNTKDGWSWISSPWPWEKED